MIKDNQKRLNRMHVLLDILVTVVAYALAWFIVISGKVLPLDEGVLKPQVYFMALIFIVPIYLIAQTDSGAAFGTGQYLQGQCHRPYALYVRAFWPAKVRKPSELFLHKDDSGILCGQYHPAGSRADINTHLPALPADQRL